MWYGLEEEFDQNQSYVEDSAGIAKATKSVKVTDSAKQKALETG